MEFPGCVLNPNSGEVALNMKQLVDDNQEHSRRRASNAADFDKAMNQVTVSNAQDSHTLRFLAAANAIISAQVSNIETQQTVSPVRTATADAIVGTEGVAAAGEAVAAQAVATSLGNLATALVPIITAAGGVVTAQTLAALLPVVITAAGGASTPSQTKPPTSA